jgi:3-hydroxymyristoyl/3-hydroxydecanoyl-(acyl carrier protein) dehydratase
MTVHDPIIVSEALDLPRVAFELIVPEDLFTLQGHFPEAAVLPGITQVHWAISLAMKHLPVKPIFLGIEALKFHRIIKPMTTLNLVLEYVETTDKLQFSYSSDQGLHSHGRVLFGQH